MHRKIKLGWLVATALATVIAAPSTAFAAPPTLERVQIELGGRYGLALQSLDYNPWGPGLGGAIGYTLDSAIYLGGSFDWFTGEEIEYADPIATMYPDPIYVGGNYWQALVWGGYDMELSESFVFRPKAGVGVSTSTIRDCNSLLNDIECRKTLRGETSIVPAAQLIFVSPVTISLEARFVMLFDSVTVKSALLGGLSIGF